MVRKITVLACMLALVVGIASTAQAATHTTYENGSLSSTYVSYFRDILSGVNLTDHYVAFRSGQYDYTMITGDISFDEQTQVFTLNGVGKEYVFTTSGSSYNSSYDYNYREIDNFSLVNDSDIIYSDLGSFPQLMDRGSKYEILTTITLCIMCLYFVIRLFFVHR